VHAITSGIIVSVRAMEETGKQRGKELGNEDNLNSVKEREFSLLDIGMPCKWTAQKL